MCKWLQRQSESVRFEESSIGYDVCDSRNMANGVYVKLLYLKSGNGAVRCREHQNRRNAGMDGGPDAFVDDLLDELEGWEVYVISSGLADDEYRGDFVAATAVRVQSRGLGKLLAHARYARVIIDAVLRFRPGIILWGQLDAPLGLCAISARMLSVPYIWALRSRITSEERGLFRLESFKRVLNYRALRRSAAILGHGPYLYEQEKECVGLDAPLIQFDCDVAYLRRAAESVRCGSGKQPEWADRAVLYVGRVEEPKGALDLFAAFASFSQRIPDAQLVYVGDGRSVGRIKELATRHGFSHRVICLDAKVYSDLAA